jgi:cytochrome P450/NADPH-cytochrome P450 reductase
MAPALLIFGCTDPEVDHLYRDELAAWAAAGIVDLRVAFSAASHRGQFVQDRLWADRADDVDLVRRGAVFYVCGDAAGWPPPCTTPAYGSTAKPPARARRKPTHG